MTYEQTTTNRIVELQGLLSEVKKGLHLRFEVHGYTRRDQVEQDIDFLKVELTDEMARQGADDGELRYREM